MARGFKTTQINESYYLYPYPVIKNQKYLILCSDYNQSKELISLIESDTIKHPDINLDNFIIVGTHTDKKTPILQFNMNS